MRVAHRRLRGGRIRTLAVALAASAACGQTTTIQVAAIDHPSGKGLSERAAACPPVVFVFMKVGIVSQRQSDIEAALRHDGDVRHLTYVGPAQAYAEFQVMFAAQPQIVGSIKPGDLPTSFRFIERDKSKEAALTAQYSSMAGVDELTFPVQNLNIPANRYLDVSDLIRKVGVPGPPCR